jgi:aspartokinase/homoserine dehydrogenase 1
MLVQELSNRTLDLILSYGERLSAYIIAQSAKPYIPSTYYLDARNLIVTDKNYGSAKVNYEETNSRISKHFKENPGVPIITGFISSTLEGDTTTLGRGGSDFTASILGAALNAECIEIWTDVDGVLTADPRKVARAFSIPQMTYKEALEMSHFGAKVIHPPTISPALKKNIPLFIKNTFNPHFPGTLISNKQSEHENSICGISSIDAVSLLRLEGNGMIGVCGIAMRLFGALAKNEISVIMITQGSSEHSICLAISPQSAHSAQQAINTEFSLERHSGLIDNVILEEGHSIVAIVGENMRKTKGIAGKVFSSLGDNEINVVAIAQGSSEYNITIVIDQKDLSKTLNVIHDKFFL